MHEKNKKHSSTNYRDNPVDDLAAVLILQTWLSDPTIAVLP